MADYLEAYALRFEQTDVAQFWGLGRPDAQYNASIRDVVTTHGMNRVQAARALALTNLVAADAYIACFDAKYTYSAWRPYTAIRVGDTDGNPATVATRAGPPWCVRPTTRSTRPITAASRRDSRPPSTT
jgi:hypothetical protein